MRKSRKWRRVFTNKKEVVNVLAQETGLTKRDSEFALDTVFQIIAGALADGHSVHITGFGTFDVKKRAPRIGRNLKTNQPVSIPAKSVPVFKPGKGLKKIVAQT